MQSHEIWHKVENLENEQPNFSREVRGDYGNFDEVWGSKSTPKRRTHGIDGGERSGEE